MRYHDHNEMCVNILRMINLGIVQDLSKHTHLASWKINNCLESLQKKFLIKKDENTQLYKITEKGTQYLNSYSKIIDLLSFKLGKKEEIAA